MNRKIFTSLLVIGMALAAIAGGTLAWFTFETEAIENVFTAGTVLIEADEEIISGADTMDNWNPGDCAVKEFTITNTGSKRIFIRTNALAGLVGQWYEPGGEIPWIPTTPVDEEGNLIDVVTITVLSEDWQRVGDYYYYQGIIDPETSVTLTIRVCLAGPLTDKSYQGKVYKMSTLFAAIQSSHDASGDAWGVWFRNGSWTDEEPVEP